MKIDEDDAQPDGFLSLGLNPLLAEAVAALGYEEPTPIQKAAIPVLLAGRDVLGQAATGTGKTAAFTLPMLQRLADQPARRAPRALIVVPTRELALQVARAVHQYGKPFGTRVAPIYGGADFGPQLKSLTRGVDVVVATPGRAIDHLRRGTLRLDEISMVVLDEADEMLDMGFQEDIEVLLDAVPEDRQIALFSATFPDRLQAIAKKTMRDPQQITVARKAATEDGPRVRQVACVVRREDKVAALIRILDLEAPEAAIIFCRTRGDVDSLADTLAARGYRVEALHGGFSQSLRERVLGRLRGGANDLLIATDVAARGIDVAHLTHVFNYDLPGSAEQYVHRIGRTGRAGRSGMAVSLITRRERRFLFQISDHTGTPITLLPVPQVADLRERQLQRVLDQTKETLDNGDLEPWMETAQALLLDEEPERIVAALLRMQHEQTAPDLDASDDKDLNAGGTDRGFARQDHGGPRGNDGHRQFGGPAAATTAPAATISPPAATTARPAATPAPRQRRPAPRQRRPRPAAHPRDPNIQWARLGSASAARPMCGRATWWAPSPARPTFAAPISAPSACWGASAWWT